MPQDIAIYCVCFPGHTPYKKQVYQQNIMCNAHSIGEKDKRNLQQQGYVFDDTGDNISELNYILGDLTASYWIWKNSPHDIVGTSQYRRFWTDAIKDIVFDKNTLYVQDPIVFEQNAKDQYIGSHGNIGLEMLEKLIEDKKIPLTKEMLEKTYALNYLYACNMFIAHKNIYDRFCEILFDIVFTIYHTYIDELNKLDPYNRRTPAFLAERIVTALIINKEHFFPELDIKQIEWKFYKKKPLAKKLFPNHIGI